MLRIAVVLLTLFMLPVYGLAGVAQRTCQEQMSASTQGAQSSDCCPGKGDQGNTCKESGSSPLSKKDSCTACKAGYNCKSPQSLEPAPALAWLILPTSPDISIDPPSLLSSHGPDGLWRPPRFI